jgi:hypothetical protein
MKQLTIIFPCKAFVTTGSFASELAGSLSTRTIKGIITEFDEESGYVNWTDLNNNPQPCVNINCVSFIWPLIQN